MSINALLLSNKVLRRSIKHGVNIAKDDQFEMALVGALKPRGWKWLAPTHELIHVTNGENRFRRRESHGKNPRLGVLLVYYCHPTFHSSRFSYGMIGFPHHVFDIS